MLDVGGTLFKTTKQTLVQAEYFKAMLERWQSDSDTPIFIDRDPDNFKHILAYLRDQQHRIPDSVLYELDFYGIKYEENNKEAKEKLMMKLKMEKEKKKEQEKEQKKEQEEQGTRKELKRICAHLDRLTNRMEINNNNLRHIDDRVSQATRNWNGEYGTRGGGHR